MIYTEIEATYKQSLLRKKANTFNDPEILAEIHTISMRTIKVLTKNMITGDVPLEKIFAHYKEENRVNCIKLLLRVIKMYNARNAVKSILSLVIKKEDKL